MGITGTNGKTTTTYLVEHIARVAGKRTGVIGTVGIRIGDAAESRSTPHRNRPTCSSCSLACATRAATRWPWR